MRGIFGYVAGWVVLACMASVAQAQTTSRFDLPAQLLADSLREVGSQTNTNVLFDPPLVAGREAPALKAELSVSQAISRLLAGSGIRYEFLNESTIVLAKAAGSGSAPTNTSSNRARATVTPAAAEESDVSSSGQLETIVVTARKRSENIQSVPISITALSGADLINENIRSVNEVALTVPNMFITASSGNIAAPTYTIRGQVQNDTTAALDPSVGIYVDGVYWARAYGTNASFLDIARVEVLKGPQGTLFGRNTTGGALNIVTQDPNYQGISGFASLVGGNRNEFDQTFGLNLPMVPDRVAARVAFSHQKSGGWIENTFNGQTLDGSNQWLGRGKVLFTPNDALRILVSAEYFNFDAAGPDNKSFIVYPAFNAAGQPTGLASLEALLQSGFTNDGTGYADGNARTVDDNQTPRSLTRTQTYSGTATLDTSWGTLKNILAYRKTDAFSAVDNDGTPFVIFDVPAVRSNVHQWSDELQASGTAFDERLNWTTGAFYFRESGYDDLGGFVLPIILQTFNTFRLGGSFLENKSYAAYAQGTFKITPRLSLTGGFRYSIDDRYKQQYQQIVDPSNPNCTAGTAPNAVSGSCLSPRFSREDKAPSYTVSLDYKFTDDILGYVKTSRGFRAGGFNSRQGANTPALQTFAPETVTDYELGFKSEFLDRRLRVNFATYYSDYRDIQSTLLTVDSTGTPTTAVQNAAKARIVGFELETTAVPFKDFEVLLSVGNTDAKYLEFRDITGDRSHEKFPLTPKWTGSLSAQYTHDVGPGNLMVRADYSYKGSVVFMQNLHPPYTEAKGYGLINARIAFTPKNSTVEIAAYGRNLADKTYTTFVLDGASAGLGFISGFYGTPRQFGGEVTVHFGESSH